MLWRFSYGIACCLELHPAQNFRKIEATKHNISYYFCVAILTNLTNSIYKFKDWQPLDYATTWLLSSQKPITFLKQSTADQLYKCSVMGPILYCDNHSRSSHHLLAILFTFEIF